MIVAHNLIDGLAEPLKVGPVQLQHGEVIGRAKLFIRPSGSETQKVEAAIHRKRQPVWVIPRVPKCFQIEARDRKKLPERTFAGRMLSVISETFIKRFFQWLETEVYGPVEYMLGGIIVFFAPTGHILRTEPGVQQYFCRNLNFIGHGLAEVQAVQIAAAQTGQFLAEPQPRETRIAKPIGASKLLVGTGTLFNRFVQNHDSEETPSG